MGTTSFFSIVLLGIVGLPNTIGGKIIFWLIAGFLSYACYVFIPFFKKKDKKYYDGFLLTWSYLVIIIIISFRTNSFEEYDYFYGFSFVIGLPFISEIFLKNRRKNSTRKSINFKNDILKIFKNKDIFVILEVTTSLNISEYQARKVLDSMLSEGIIQVKKSGSTNYYKIIKK